MPKLGGRDKTHWIQIRVSAKMHKQIGEMKGYANISDIVRESITRTWKRFEQDGFIRPILTKEKEEKAPDPIQPGVQHKDTAGDSGDALPIGTAPVDPS